MLTDLPFRKLFICESLLVFFARINVLRRLAPVLRFPLQPLELSLLAITADVYLPRRLGSRNDLYICKERVFRGQIRAIMLLCLSLDR